MKQRLGDGPATLDNTIATISAKDIAKRALVALVMCHWIVKGREGLANRPFPLRTSVLMDPRILTSNPKEDEIYVAQNAQEAQMMVIASKTVLAECAKNHVFRKESLRARCVNYWFFGGRK